MAKTSLHSVMFRARYYTDIDAVPASVWRTSRRSVYFTADYLRAFGRALPCDLTFMFSEDLGQVSLLPVLSVGSQSYRYFHPTGLLGALLERVGREDLVARLSYQMSEEALVAAIPFGYTSPLEFVAPEMLGSVLSELDDLAATRGVNQLAVLYWSEGNGEWCLDAFRKAGYKSVCLEANAMIEIDPGWCSFRDYAAATARPRQITRERAAFEREGITFAWHSHLSDYLIKEFTGLEAELLASKGERIPLRDIEQYYFSVRRHMPDHILSIVARKGLDAIGFVLFMLDGDTLIGKTIGMPATRPRGLYFNLNYYKPIEYAITHGFRRIDQGPAAGQAKRIRGFTPRWLMGAFKFGDTHPVRQWWPEIVAAVAGGARDRWA